ARPHTPLGAPRDGAREVTGGGAGPAPGENELLERRQRIVEPIERLFQLRHVRGGDGAVAGNAQLAAHVEQLVLHLGEAGSDRRRQVRHGEQHADGAVELIHGTVGLDAHAVLGNPGAVPEAGGAVIAGARVDLAQAVSHGRILSEYAIERTQRGTGGGAGGGRGDWRAL